MESKINDISSSAATSEHHQIIDLQIIDRDHTHFHIPNINNNVNRPRIDETIIDISCNIQDWRESGDKYGKTQDLKQIRDKSNVEAKNCSHESRCQGSGTIRKTLFQSTSHNKSHDSIAGGEHGKEWKTQECRESNRESCRRKQQEVCISLSSSSYSSHVSEFPIITKRM
jgi:hypothetical protein